MELLVRDKSLVARGYKPENIEITKSEGSILFDAEGKQYIDFVMGWCVGNFGWGNEEITSAIKNYKGPAYVYPGFKYGPWEELAGILGEITPGNLNKCFRATGGTDSIEVAMKIAMLYTNRDRFLSVDGSYHGNSFGAMSISSSGYRNVYSNLLPHCYKIEAPLTEKSLDDVEEILKHRDIAAFILEPVLTHPGIHVPDKKFMSGIQELCKKYGTLIVADEVAVGFGRTGKIFASDHFNLKPDIICMAKAISGGYAAIGAAVTSEEIGNAVERKVSGYPTFGWHPLSVEATIANLNYMIGNKEEILGNVEKLNALFRERFLKMTFRHEAKVNMIGLAIGIDVGNYNYAMEISEKCLKKGLVIEYNNHNLMMFPSLTMGEDIANLGLDILEKCVK